MFSLIGPKRYDAPWKDIESQGWIAPAECTEVRVTLTDAERMTYATAEAEERYRMAATARAGQDDEARLGAFDDLDSQVQDVAGPDEQPSGVSGVGPDQGDGGEAFAESGQ